MKRSVKEHPIGIDYLHSEPNGSVQKEESEQLYEVTKKIFKAGKVLVIAIQRVNRKMLFTAFC